MQNHHETDRLSWGDTVFLHLEREGMPLNVASVSVLEGKIPFETCLQFIESKLPLIPRYLKRVVPPALNVGLPSWEYDPTFDIHNHIHEARLKYGTDTELKALAGKIFSTVMDRKHPLWDITFVSGLKGDRTGLIFRLHHCLADGIAGVGIMSKLLDASPTATPLPKSKTRLHVPPPQDPIKSLIDGVATSYSEVVKRMLAAWADMLNMAERATENTENLAPPDEFSRLLPEITSFTERIRFNVIYRGPQKFAWADIPLADVKAIRETCGASVNDVILALVTSAIRHYLELHGDPIQGRLLRMMVPVNLRGTDSPGDLGNRISLVPVTIPLDIRNPRKLLAAVHERTEFLKRSHAAEIVSLAGGLIGMCPSPMQGLAGPLISQLPITPFNLVCTNVPGPQYPLYLLGHKMLRWYPYVPVGGEMAVNCAILSYDGMVYFGFSGDVHVASDLRRLEDFLKLSFRELQEAVGMKLSRKEKKSVRAKKRTNSRATAKPVATANANASASASMPKAPVASVQPPAETWQVRDEEKAVTQMSA